MNKLSTARTAEAVGAEIRQLANQARCMTVWFGVEIGRRLKEAKELVPYGQWGDWIKTETGYSQTTATRFMKVYEEYSAGQLSIFGAEVESSTLQNLSISNALRLLAIPEREREEFAEANDVAHKSARELDELIRQRDEAVKKAEAADKAAAAENDTAKKSKQELEELRKKLSELEAEKERADDELSAAMEERDKAEATVAEAKKTIKELRERPVDVAVEVDRQAIATAEEQARATAEQKWSKKADKLAKAAETANKKLDEALNAAKAAEENAAKTASEMQERQRQLAEELEKTKKELRASDGAAAAFKVHFNAAQEAFLAAAGLLGEMEEETADRLRGALRALIEKLGAAI